MAGLRLVVGLGNPGAKYARTRHNVGFRLADLLAGEAGRWKDFRGLGQWSQGEGLLAAKPLTYMNESGKFVQAVSSFYKISPAEMIICFDDVALPLGRIRLRPGGSSGGQKGMQSIIDALGTQDIPRLRIGVGPQPAGWDSADFVLSRFGPEEEEILPQVLENALQAIKMACEGGLAAAMNRFNPSA